MIACHWSELVHYQVLLASINHIFPQDISADYEQRVELQVVHSLLESDTPSSKGIVELQVPMSWL